MSNNGTPVSISEVFLLLRNIKDRYNNGRIKSHEIFMQTFQYVETFKKVDDSNALEEFKTYLTAVGFTEEEIAAYINLLPSSIIETKMLLPSLARLNDAILESVILKTKEIVYL